MKSRGKSRGPQRHKRPRAGEAERPAPRPARAADPAAVMASRELFWQNVMREILTSLSTMGMMRPGVEAAEASTRGKTLPPADGDGEGAREGRGFQPELFDGRLAVVTKTGQRIPIADVFPLFACGIDTPTPGERTLAMAVECTVFQIRTPGGEVFTLPLHEIRGFHSLTPELMQQLERAAAQTGEAEEEEVRPFGFAAFTSLAQGGPSVVPQAPDYPME